MLIVVKEQKTKPKSKGITIRIKTRTSDLSDPVAPTNQVALDTLSLRRSKPVDLGITQNQTDSALGRVMQYYDLGSYADALEDIGLSGRKMAEIRAVIAMDEDQKPGVRMRALSELERLLDRNVEAGGYKKHGKAKATIPGVGSVTVSTTAIRESQRIADMFKQGLGNDSLPLYAPDLNQPTQSTKMIEGSIANSEGHQVQTAIKENVSEDQPKEQAEGTASSNLSVSADGGHEGSDEGSPGTASGTESKQGGTGLSPHVAGDSSQPTSPFCQSTGRSAEGDRWRHIGHWRPSAFVPGGGVTGVPRGSDPFTYGQESCISFEEARRLAKCAVNEGIIGSEHSPGETARVETETNQALHKAESDRDDNTRGRSITSRRVGPVTMYEVVQGGHEEADQVLSGDGSQPR